MLKIYLFLFIFNLSLNAVIDSQEEQAARKERLARRIDELLRQIHPDEAPMVVKPRRHPAAELFTDEDRMPAPRDDDRWYDVVESGDEGLSRRSSTKRACSKKVCIKHRKRAAGVKIKH